MATSTIVNNVVKPTDGTMKSWTPQIYDYETYKRDFPTTTETISKYVEIGNFVVAFFIGNSSSQPDLSGISTMLQIRNLPMSVVAGGMIYIGALAGVRELVIQAVQAPQIYIRPNLKSSEFSNPAAPGIVTFVVFGYKR